MKTESAIPPTPSDRQLTGWIEAGFYVIAVALVSIVYAMAIAAGAHVIVFIVYSLLVSATGMLIATGLGNEPLRIMMAPASWIIGLANLVLEAAYCLMLVTISPAEGNLIVRLAIPFAVFLGWAFFRRQPRPGVWLGALIVFIGVCGLGFTLNLSTQWMGIVYGMMAAAAISIRGFAAEFHAWNRSARTVADKMRVTGLVVLTNAIISMSLIVFAATLVGSGVLVRNDLFPAPSDLLHWPTVVYAVLVGGAIFTAMNYLQFSAVVKIRTENLIATSAFMPVATLIAQTLAGAAGLIVVGPFDWRLVPIMALAVIGVLILIKSQKPG